MTQDINASRRQQQGRQGELWKLQVIVQGLRSLIERLIAALRRLGVWGLREFGDTVACLLCVYLGVLVTMIVPSSASLLMGAPHKVTLTIVLFVGLSKAINITHQKGLKKWRDSGRPLGEKMLAAISLGITWGK